MSTEACVYKYFVGYLNITKLRMVRCRFDGGNLATGKIIRCKHRFFLLNLYLTSLPINIMLLIKCFCINPVKGPRSAVLAQDVFVY